MRGIYTSVEQLVGGTPLLELTRIEEKENLKARVLAKLECFNPGGSAKDRPAAYMLSDAEEKGLIHSDTVIVEPTSGNQGIGLALIGARQGDTVVANTAKGAMELQVVSVTRAKG